MLEGFPPVIRPKMFETLASGKGLISPVWNRALSIAAILKSPKLWKRLLPALVPPVITQLAVQKLVGTVEFPEVITVPRLAGLPVPPVGEIAVVGPAAWARTRKLVMYQAISNDAGIRRYPCPTKIDR